jgi:protein associated with RNAse G/E
MSRMKMKVQKKNLSGEIMVEYEGNVLQRRENSVTLEALFTREATPVVDVIFKKDDRFVEYFYADRWYNIFTVHDRDHGNIKGWYCNVSKPAEIETDVVSYVDLALDLWVAADGKQTVLDEDEFEELDLSKELSAAALKGMDELKEIFHEVPPKLNWNKFKNNPAH